MEHQIGKQGRIDEVLTLSREEHQVGLHDIVIGQDDVEWRVEDHAAVLTGIRSQGQMQIRGDDLLTFLPFPPHASPSPKSSLAPALVSMILPGFRSRCVIS